MKIEVFNPNNPGAKFTKNTEFTLVSYYHELEKKGDKNLNFSDFRIYMQKSFGINNSNSRNIFAFCKNCGLLDYESGQGICFNSFFTPLGKAYIKAIESISILKNQASLSADEKASLNQFLELRKTIIFQCLKNLLKQIDCDYVSVLQDMLTFLINYNSIDKNEYALLLYFNRNKKELETTVLKYREYKINIDVWVNVRNDDSGIKGERILKNDIGFLTSWSYLIGMLVEAGLVEKDNQRYCLLQGKTELVKELIGVEND